MRGPADECVCDTRLWHKAYCYLWQSMWLAAVHRTGAVRRPRRQAYWEHLRCMNEKSCVREATVPCTVRRAGALAASARGLCPQYLRAQAVARSFDVPAADLDAAVPAGLLAAVEAEVGLQDGGGHRFGAATCFMTRTPLLMHG